MSDNRLITLIDTATAVADQLRVIACLDYSAVGGTESASYGLQSLLHRLADELSASAEAWGADHRREPGPRFAQGTRLK